MRRGREGGREFVRGREGQPPRPEANLFFVHLVTLNLKVHLQRVALVSSPGGGVFEFSISQRS
jgi:hypothetical protein